MRGREREKKKKWRPDGVSRTTAAPLLAIKGGGAAGAGTHSAKMSGGGERLFDWSDYLVFAFMLAVSAAIGLYHGCRRGRTGQSSKEFLTGNGQLGTVPVALSMLARLDSFFCTSLCRKSVN